MDESGTWEASALFSPSKARAQQAQAKDWASVDAWLSKKYASKRVPSFERNEETLQVLLTLALHNENSDEQRGNIDRVEKAALQAFTKRLSHTSKSLHFFLLDNSKDTVSLDNLASAAVDLNSVGSEYTSLASSIVDLTASQFELSQQRQRAEAQLKGLESEQTRLQNMLNELEGDDFKLPSELLDQTGEWNRTAKHLKSKVTEYEERLSSLRSSATISTTIEDIQNNQKALSIQKTRLAEIQVELEAYQSLPTNGKAARDQLEKARSSLRELVKKRDGLFESLADD